MRRFSLRSVSVLIQPAVEGMKASVQYSFALPRRGREKALAAWETETRHRAMVDSQPPELTLTAHGYVRTGRGNSCFGVVTAGGPRVAKLIEGAFSIMDETRQKELLTQSVRALYVFARLCATGK